MRRLGQKIFLSDFARTWGRRARTLKISFECSILYRLLVLMGAHFLRSSRCRKATGLSVQLTYRNPSGCPLPSLRNMSGERNHHAITSNPTRRIDYSSLTGRLHRICSDSDHRLHLGRVDTGKNRLGNGGEKCRYRRRARTCSHLRR